jgi:hypothetical protein
LPQVRKISLWVTAILAVVLISAIAFLQYSANQKINIISETKKVEATVVGYAIANFPDGTYQVTPNVTFELKDIPYATKAPAETHKVNPYENIDEQFTITVHYLPDDPTKLVDVKTTVPVLYQTVSVYLSLAVLGLGLMLPLTLIDYPKLLSRRTVKIR